MWWGERKRRGEEVGKTVQGKIFRQDKNTHTSVIIDRVLRTD